MKILRVGAAALVALFVVCASAPVVLSADGSDQTPFATGLIDPDALTRILGAHVTAAQQMLDRLVAEKPPHTVEKTLRLYDDIALELGRAQNPALVLANMHPDEAMQKAADAILVRAREVEANRLSNRAVYEALAAIDVSRADGVTRYYLQRELSVFRRNGVDKDEATRGRINDLRAKLAVLMGDYRRNVRTTTRSMVVAAAADLAGLPDDFIAKHKPGPMGGITLKADEFAPVVTFARSTDVRRRMFIEATNVGYPENVGVLNEMVAMRSDLARQLGWESFAAYDFSSRMTGKPSVVRDFIERAVREARPKIAREYAELLAAKRQDEPDAQTINAWEYQFYRERVRRTAYAFDSQSVRPYFPYDRVRDGLLTVASKMFGVTFRARTDVPVWHPSVQVYDMLEDGRVIGRIYFDTHPRPNKQVLGGLTAMAATGVEGRQIPEAVLQASVPGGQPGDPGLLTYDDVRGTLFHEFAHCIQNIFSGQQRWFGLSRTAEDDFIEAVPRLLEEWAADPGVLATFARHYQTNEPMPAELMARMRRANEFAKGMIITGDVTFARMAFELHQRDPKSVDATGLMRQLLTSDAPWLYADGSHREASFTQAANSNYAAAYYTYEWSRSIAKDMMTVFDQRNLMAPGPAHRLRDLVMKRGGAAPAADIVRDFLGRPFTQDAWSAWINRDPS